MYICTYMYMWISLYIYICISVIYSIFAALISPCFLCAVSRQVLGLPLDVARHAAQATYCGWLRNPNHRRWCPLVNIQKKLWKTTIFNG